MRHDIIADYRKTHPAAPAATPENCPELKALVKASGSAQLKDSIRVWFGLPSNPFSSTLAPDALGAELVSRLKAALPGQTKMTLTGQSMGGSLALYAGLKTQTEVVTTNALGIGPRQQHHLGLEALQSADQLVTNISTKNDIMSGHSAVEVADKASRVVGLRTTGLFGPRLQLDSIFKEIAADHELILASLLHRYAESLDTGAKQTLQKLCKERGSPECQEDENKWKQVRKDFLDAVVAVSLGQNPLAGATAA